MIIKRLINKIKSVRFSNKKNVSGRVVIKGNVWHNIKKTASIKIGKQLTLGEKSFGNNRQTLLRMDDWALLKIIGKAEIFYGCDIIVFQGGTLSIGNNTFINSDAKIRCHKSITIGDNCSISHDFTIMDSNAHSLNGDKKTMPVVIENNVWIGTRVTVLSGVTIGEGSVIAAGCVVTKDVPPHTLFGGVPGRVIKEDITWEL